MPIITEARAVIAAPAAVAWRLLADYANDPLWRARVRRMLNYLHVRVDRLNPAGPDDPEPFGPAPSTPPVGVQIGQTLDIVALRFRYSF